MRICFFGNYDEEYNRNAVLIAGFERNNIKLQFCHTNKKGLSGVKDLYLQHKKIPNYDIMLVAYSDSRYLVPLAKFLTRKKIVWDAFYSVYDSVIFDRKLAKKYSFKAAYYWVSDWLSCVLADHILLDTYAHIQYFSETFHIKKGAFH